ncbi:MAG: ASCH domain-containing protein [Alkalispirochaetaceae bacterium]
MPYISMDHHLLTSSGIPCNGSRALEQLLGEEVERFEVPWAPEWIVLRGASFSGLPKSRGPAVAWLPRLLWPGDISLSYQNDLLQGKLAGEPFTVWAFGNSPELADELLHLVLVGTKSATCGSVAAYELEEEPLPRVGDLSVVTDSRGVPRAIIRTTEAVVKRFGEVDEQFAHDEGEGDRSYEFWRSAHEEYFTMEAKETGAPFGPNLPVVCERFELVDRFEED